MRNENSLPKIAVTDGADSGVLPENAYWLQYANAVSRAGGTPVHVGPDFTGSMDEFDGLLLSGGCDVHPDHYDRLPGDEGMPADEVIGKYGMQCDRRRDSVELRLTQQALGAQKPILAICRGIQVLNIVLAHRLIPDLGICLPGALTHRSEGSGESLRHEVEIEPGSLVERAYRSARIVVNTRHHQGMTRAEVPPSLRVTAIAPDGVVEAVESITSHFVVGVQWHPEREKDAFIHGISGALFEAFVEASQDLANRWCK